MPQSINKKSREMLIAIHGEAWLNKVGTGGEQKAFNAMIRRFKDKPGAMVSLKLPGKPEVVYG